MSKSAAWSLSFEKHYVRALLISVENELTKIVGLPFVYGKFAARVLTVHEYF